MLRHLRRIIQMVARHYERRTSRCTSPRPGVAFHPRVELLEAREVPAAIVWRNYSRDYDFNNAANWMDDATLLPIGRVPTGGDDVYFRRGLGSVADCENFHGAASAYNSVNLINDYTGTITLSSGFTTGTLIMDDGDISQPTAGTDITVTTNFTWTFGVLNTSNNLSNLNLNGATAVFAPEQTLDLGSNVNLSNGAVATLKEGTINVTNDGVDFNINANCGLLVDPGESKTTSVNVNMNPAEITQINIATGGWVKVTSGGKWLSDIPLKNEGGSFILEGGTFAHFNRGVDAVNNGPSYKQTSGATYIAADATVSLGIFYSGMFMSGGAISIKCGPKPDPATSTFRANIWGDLTITGGVIEYDAAGGDRRNWGEFLVIGDVLWSGGTYYHFVDAQTEGVGDLWKVEGDFTISGSPTVDVTALDFVSIAVPPSSGWEWNLFEATGTITAANGTPSLSGVGFWGYVFDLNNPKKWWDVVGL